MDFFCLSSKKRLIPKSIAFQANLSGGQGCNCPPSFQNLGKIIIFRAAIRKYFGKTRIFRAVTKKNLSKIRNFRAAIMIKCKKYLPNLGEDLFFREHHDFLTKLRNLRLIQSEEIFFGLYSKILDSFFVTSVKC